MEYDYDNLNYYDGDWGNSGSQWVRPLSQINLTENEKQLPPIEIEFGDVEDWDTDRVGG